MKKYRGQIRRLLVISTLSLTLFVLAFLIIWSKIKFNIGVICPLNYCFDIDCPGCGVTRMFVAILQCDVYQAFRYNPFVFSTLPILFVVYIWQSVVYIIKDRLLKYIDIFLMIYAILLALFGIIRNFNFFSYLAPTVV